MNIKNGDIKTWKALFNVMQDFAQFYEDNISTLRVIHNLSNIPINKKDFLPEKQNTILSYNSKTGDFQFMDKLIPIPLNTDQSALCEVIFKSDKSIRKLWDWDEIVKSWGDTPEPNMWRKVYQAAREINKKIARYTLINNFFIVKKCTVTINPKYLN